MNPPKTNKRTGAVQLMTVHASKGLEWDAVFVVGVEEGVLPYQTALDEGDLAEERRLCYVAITRARRHLHLSGPVFIYLQVQEYVPLQKGNSNVLLHHFLSPIACVSAVWSSHNTGMTVGG